MEVVRIHNVYMYILVIIFAFNQLFKLNSSEK